MKHYLGTQMQQSFAKLGLLPATTDALPEVDPAVAQIEKSKLLGTTLAIPSFFEIKESDGVRMLSEKNRISFFRSPRCLQT